MRWDPVQYNRFSTERNQPFFDLTARMSASAPFSVVDLGCGPGDLTASLSRRWPAAQILGIDSSEEMIQRANTQPDAPPNLRFEIGDVAHWQPAADVDLVVSNALLQWIPGHDHLLGQWAEALPPGAWIGFQVPGNFDSPSHRLMGELAAGTRWREQLGGVLRHSRPVLQPSEYLELLMDKGFQAQAWETTYLHILTGADPVLQWVRGTGLRPVLNALSAKDAAEFEEEYGELLRAAYPATAHGTLFPFRRIFCVGRKGIPGHPGGYKTCTSRLDPAGDSTARR